MHSSVSTSLRHLSASISFRGAFALLLAISSLTGLVPQAKASHYVYTNPQFLWNAPNIGTPFEPSLQLSWADVQANPAYNYTYTYPNGDWYSFQLINLHSDYNVQPAIVFNFLWDYLSFFDQKSCQSPAAGPVSCNTATDFNFIQSTPVCPAGFGGGGLGGTDSNPRHDLKWCQKSVSDFQPPPTGCKSCLGNPIYAGSGLKEQKETDYAGPAGLQYERTYRSDTGAWTSAASATFVDYSQAGAVLTNQCYASYYTIPNTTTNVSSCFQYIGVGQQAYQLVGSTGRTVQFSGPNTAITRNPDVNERVSQINVGGVNEWKVVRDDDTVEIYNVAGSMLQKTLRGGRTFTYTYSTAATPPSIAPRAGLLLSQSDAFGHTLSWQYGSTSQITQMTDPAGDIYLYTYDSVGNLTGIKYPDNSTKIYSYNESAYTGGNSLLKALTGITDEASVRYATFQYTVFQDPTIPIATNTQHAGGVDSYTFSYDAAAFYNNPISHATVTDPLGTTKTYNFNNPYGLSFNYDASQVQPAASGSGTVTQSEAQDANGNTSQLTEFNGNITTYSYDLTRNLETSRTEAYGTPRARTITTSWDPTWRQPALISVYAGGTATGTPLRTTGFTYDALGNVLTKTVTDPATAGTRVWTYTYDTYGRMLTADGPRTDVIDKTTYAYYTCTTGGKCGQLNTVTDAKGRITTYTTYNAHGQPLTITDPNGVVTTLTYDLRLRMTSRKVGTELTSFSYWPTGLLKQVTLPDSSYVLYTYDGAHRLTQINDQLGNKIVYTLDNAGNRTAENSYDVSSILHRTHSRVINALNQVYQDVNAAGTAAVTTTFGYDNNGNQTSVAAPMARNTGNAYDELNRLSQITDPASGITQFGYDATDNLTSVIDPRTLTTGYVYNGFGDVKTLTSPDTGTTNNTYDSGGNLATSTDARGAISTYGYDALNRVTSVAYKIGTTTDQTITFTYDAGTNGIGRLTGASDANHSMSWTYDGLGRVIGKGQTLGTVTKSVGYGYTNGDLTSVVTPSGQTVTYGYNSNHQVTSIAINGTTLLSGAVYEPFGGIDKWTWGNATVTTRTYDTDQKITQISSQGVRTNTYDNAFRITGITNTTTGSSNYTYGYDLLDRVTSGVGAVNQTFTYDANGNRLTVGGGSSSSYTVSPTSNRVTGISGGQTKTYTYDAAGNPLQYTPVVLTYNNRGRLKTVQTTSNTETIVYNALGQMIKVSGGAPGTVLYMYDEAGHLLGEYSSTGALVEETVWLGDIPVATIRPGSPVVVYYVHTDHLNTPHVITRSTDNAQMWTWFPATFGETAASGTLTYNLRFPGQIYDSQGKLLQNYMRDYDPVVGRYVESDPISLGSGRDSYSYVRNNPVTRLDSSGLFLATSGPPADNSNTIVCDGIGGFAVHLQADLDPLSRECIGDCITRHEDSHIEDAIAQNPSLCRGVRPGMEVVFSGQGPTAAAANDAKRKEQAASEIKAYNIEIACLEAKLRSMGCDNRCKQAVADRLAQIKPERDKFVSGNF